MALEAEGVVSLVLEPLGEEFPRWTPGAHLDLQLGPELVRQYSLCGDPDQRETIRVAVLREVESRGGSAWVHDRLRVGEVLDVSAPRNHFELVPSPAYRFVAGGIGITPILPMIRAVAVAGKPWTLYYGGRTAASMAFLGELSALDPEGVNVHVLPQEEHGLLPLQEIVGGAEATGADLYACGPAPLLDALDEVCRQRGCEATLHVERFSPVELAVPDAEGERPFEVVLAKSGFSCIVEPGESILERLLESNADVAFSCEEGICGSCEVRVLEGRPLHRDSVLSEEEREKGDRMMICVSRCRDERLVIDA